MKKKTMCRKVAVFGTMMCLAVGLSACGSGDSGSETVETVDASEEESSSLAGKYLPYAADYADLVMSYTDLVEAEMVNDNWIVINEDETSGEFGTEEGPCDAEIDVKNGTLTADGVTLGFEVQEDGSLKVDMTYGDEYGDDMEKLYMYYAKEGEAYEKAKEESEANSSFAELREELDLEETELAEEDTDAAAEEEVAEEAEQEEDLSAALEGFPSGDGIADKQTVIDAYDQIYNSDDKFSLTYETVKDMIGTDGELNAKESSEEQLYYLWYGEDSNVILTVVFKFEGEETATLNSYAISGDYQ